MKDKKFLAGLFAASLAFALTALSCDTGGGISREVVDVREFPGHFTGGAGAAGNETVLKITSALEWTMRISEGGVLRNVSGGLVTPAAGGLEARFVTHDARYVGTGTLTAFDGMGGMILRMAENGPLLPALNISMARSAAGWASGNDVPPPVSFGFAGSAEWTSDTFLGGGNATIAVTGNSWTLAGNTGVGFGEAQLPTDPPIQGTLTLSNDGNSATLVTILPAPFGQITVGRAIRMHPLVNLMRVELTFEFLTAMGQILNPGGPPPPSPDGASALFSR